MRKILLATALLGSLMVPWQARQTLPRCLSGRLAAGMSGRGQAITAKAQAITAQGPMWLRAMAPRVFEIGWVGPGYYYNPGYYDRYYHPRYGYCRSVWYQGNAGLQVEQAPLVVS